MRGNAAILKCLIPSFVADFVQVTAWINDDGEEILPGNEYNGGKNETIQRCNESTSSLNYYFVLAILKGFLEFFEINFFLKLNKLETV